MHGASRVHKIISKAHALKLMRVCCFSPNMLKQLSTLVLLALLLLGGLVLGQNTEISHTISNSVTSRRPFTSADQDGAGPGTNMEDPPTSAPRDIMLIALGSGVAIIALCMGYLTYLRHITKNQRNRRVTSVEHLPAHVSQQPLNHTDTMSPSDSLPTLSTSPIRGPENSTTKVNSRHSGGQLEIVPMDLVSPRPEDDDDELTNNTAYMTTVASVDTELSIPGFLELQYGVDFMYESLIGRGGSGSVYTCSPMHPDLIRRSGELPLVVKIFEMSAEKMTPRMRAAFFQELSVMWKFRQYPHFVKVYGYTTTPASLVMRNYRYGELGRYIRGRGPCANFFPYTKRQVLGLLSNVLSAVHLMHQTGFAHCDLKPGNVLLEVDLGKNLVGVLADFGIARIVDKSTLKVHAFEISEIAGVSMAYAAPEAFFYFRQKKVCEDADVIKGGDVYALSILMLEVLQRRRGWKIQK